MTGLVVRDGVCLGVVAYDLNTGKIQPLKARAVIFGTGGYGRVYKLSTNAYINLGSGIGIAYRAGVALKDLEFVQFHPTSLIGKNILITEAARGEGGYLVNNQGRRFMEDYAPKAMELAPRDITSRAIQMEINKGNGFEDKYVHLDLRHLGREKIHKLLPGIQEVCIHFGGFDPVDKPIPIQPAQHYSMGGIDVDKLGRLFHRRILRRRRVRLRQRPRGQPPGRQLAPRRRRLRQDRRAGRPRTTSRARAGKANADQALTADAEAYVSKVKELRAREKGENVYRLLNDLKELMSENVGIYRKEQPLRVALDGIRALREGYKAVGLHGASDRYSQELITLIEFDYMLDIAEVIVLGALTRTETRGSHYRTDFPVRNDDDWLKHTLMTWTDKGPQISYRPVLIDKYKLEARKY